MVMKITPVVVVSCVRDLALLELQAQSISKYLDTTNPVFIIVNEQDPDVWFDYFNKHIRHYYAHHQLTILHKQEVAGSWDIFVSHGINPWSAGWQSQQALKLLISTRLNSEAYLLLDSQNFLIRSWSANYTGDRVPYRTGLFVMPVEAHYSYARSLNINNPPDPLQTGYMAMCTPFYMHAAMVQELIEFTGGTDKFVAWFAQASAIRSEFMLYALWLYKQGGVDQFHAVVEDYANPMLRDSKTNFDQKFSLFLKNIGKHLPHAWVSANHRSWGDMNQSQYQALCRRLSHFQLEPKFDDYRSSYVDYRF